MMFTGVVVHMMSSSNMNIAINSMINYHSLPSTKPYMSACKVNSSSFGSEIVKKRPGDFSWNSNQKHTLLGSWAWFMGLAQLSGGILCQKYGGKLVFGYSNLIIGAANFLIPTAAEISIYALIALRAIQGMAGGAGIGNGVKFFTARWVPPHERGIFAATISGIFFGTSLSYFLNGFIDHLLGWRYIFYSTGTISLVWCMLWYLIVHDSPKIHPQISESELSHIQLSIGTHMTEKKLPIPWTAILTSVPVAVNTLCQFSTLWTATTVMIYTPMYLTNVFGFPTIKVGELASMPYLFEGCFSLIFAFITDYIMKRKILPATYTRKIATSLNTILAAILYSCISLAGCDSVLMLVLLNCAVMFGGATLSGIAPNVVDLSPNFCVVIHGLQGLISSTAGILSPLLVNYYTAHDKNDPAGWNRMFLTLSAISIVCGLLFLIFGESQVQPWNAEREKSTEANNTLLSENEKVEVKPKSPA